METMTDDYAAAVAEHSATEVDTVDTADNDTFDTDIADAPVDDSFVDADPGTEPDDVEYVFDIDGNPVTLEEARKGYLRQSDYTRKTQDLAAQRQRLAQAESIQLALEKDPVATLQALADAFGVEMSAEQAADELALLDPEAARLAALEREIASIKARDQQVLIDQELNSLRSTYGDFDEVELYNHALAGNFTSLTAAYRDMMFDSVAAQAAAVAEQKRKQEAATAAKRQAAAVTHTRSDVTAGAAPQPPEGGMSIHDAFRAALKQHGYA